MQTIETRYIGATNTKGSRIKATHSGGVKSVTIGFYSVDGGELEVHAAAAKALMDKLNWHGTMFGGGTERGMVWVFQDEQAKIAR